MSTLSARGMKTKHDRCLSVTLQCLCEHGKRLASRLLMTEKEEDIEEMQLVQLLAPKAGFMPLSVAGFAIRNSEQLQDHHETYTIFDRIAQEIREHLGEEETDD